MPLRFDEYMAGIGDDHLVADMMVGDIQRILEYSAREFTIPQNVPDNVLAAYQRLRAAGFDRRLLSAGS